jgi:hypothetical protein
VRPLDLGLRQEGQGLEDRYGALFSSAEGVRFFGIRTMEHKREQAVRHRAARLPPQPMSDLYE